MNPYDKAHELVRALRESEEYRTMKQSVDQVSGDDQAKRMITDFHMKQLEFERNRLLGQEPTQEDQEDLQKLYDVLQLHTAVRDYLRAEYQFGMIIQDIQKILSDALEEITIMPELTEGSV
ncbi:MAG: YlbF family regulator [Acidibacillus sp.]|uniref:UPF0342 protein MM817_00724 n=1 Tax=Sulfoacidibacillus ferrooxidans TaxID=2005001 RepID=A0A9X1V7K5_9BACL|nr:YlbF family regulator [Sulfoacidibacillus ferrooxidans]MCI0182464.1 hypothetical protein [Sulfoacidibacillus ferrooxidans]MCY0894354.1 YlbF family regulator [Acidibacillus sp.]